MNVYLTTEERKIVHRVATALGTSDSQVVRLTLRKLIGLPLSDSDESEVRRLSEVGSTYVQNLTGAR